MTSTQSLPKTNNKGSTQPPQESKPINCNDNECKTDHFISDDETDEYLGGDFDTMEEEIAFLRSQNQKLKQKYKYHKSQHLLFQSAQKHAGAMQMKINGQLVKVQQPLLTNMTLDELSAKIEQRLPKFLQNATQNAANNSNNDKIYVPSNEQNEIGIIDIQNVDLWDMVKYDTVNKDNALATFDNDDNNLELEDSDALGGPYIVLRESDIIDAIACFIAKCVMDIPECRNLDHEQMMKMINGTFAELKSKGPLGKMLDWGSFIYQSFGWTTTAYTVYRNAAMAKTVLSCLVSAAFFIGVL